jgi:hypothetical protein
VIIPGHSMNVRTTDYNCLSGKEFNSLPGKLKSMVINTKRPYETRTFGVNRKNILRLLVAVAVHVYVWLWR